MTEIFSLGALRITATPFPSSLLGPAAHIMRVVLRIFALVVRAQMGLGAVGDAPACRFKAGSRPAQACAGPIQRVDRRSGLAASASVEKFAREVTRGLGRCSLDGLLY